MNQSVAIIGASFDLPQIKSWLDLKNSLSDKSSFIGEMPANRLKDLEEAFGFTDMAKAGYISQVDQFDNEYFGFTKRESLKLSPEQRIFLSHGVRALYNAGYSKKKIEGTGTGVFYVTSPSAYYNLAEVSDITFSDFDFIEGIEGTRLAQYLDLRGPVVAIDTTCSSSLVAINAARQSLNSHECDVALVGGVNILTLTKRDAEGNVVHSPSEYCKPFDDGADGMMNGEGVIFFVLKRYEQALIDGDPILAEIKGVGINHGGRRISSLTAPDAEAQKDVLVKAWKNAGVSLGDVKYIEAHGTGTILGDPIEMEGLKRAISEANHSGEVIDIAISSVKGQIGHLDKLSGLVGLLRVVAALNFRKVPVQANFSKLNEHINLSNTGLYISEQSKDWNSDNSERVSGVSSFGMTGTNVHLVVAQKESEISQSQNNEFHYFQISHTDKEGLEGFIEQLCQSINQIDSLEGINAIGTKLNRVFQLDNHNQSFIYNSKASLLDALRKPQPLSATKEFLLLDLDIVNYAKETVQKIFLENTLIKEKWDEFVHVSLDELPDSYRLNILFQYTVYKYLFDLLGSQLTFITTKEDSVCNLLIKSKVTVDEVINQPLDSFSGNKSFDEKAFKDFLMKKYASQSFVIIDFSNEDKSRFKELSLALTVIDGRMKNTDRFNLYSDVLSLGTNPLITNLNPLFLYDVELQYLRPKRFWPTITKSIQPDGQESETSAESIEHISYSKDEIKAEVKYIWETILEIEGIAEDEDFFDLGGTSLEALDIVEHLEKKISGLKLPLEALYEYNTIPKLVDSILSRLDQSQGQNQTAPPSPQVPTELSAESREQDYQELIARIEQSKFGKHQPENILITGATGFLGGEVLKYLSSHTSAKIYCLVRTQDGMSAEERFQSVFGNTFKEEQRASIQILEGDLLKMDLGIRSSPSDFQIDTVFHVAGSPSFTSREKAHEHINYVGTKHIVDWSNQYDISNLIYISTVGVTGQSMPDHVKNFYETDLDIGQTSDTLIHASSKIMAETYINEHFGNARKIFRIPNIGGRYADGVFTSNLKKNLMWLRLDALAQLGYYCDEILDHYSGISFFPVDLLAQIICEASLIDDTALNTYHLSQINGFSIGELVEAFKIIDLNSEQVSYEVFEKKISATALSMHDVGKSVVAYDFRDEATSAVLSKNHLFELMNFDRKEYLEKLIQQNIEFLPSAQKVSRIS
ncbi:MAG: beta-ketoacyl synthase N-terminal-like domain-containing protein [Bacteroidota bacterium]